MRAYEIRQQQAKVLEKLIGHPVTVFEMPTLDSTPLAQRWHLAVDLDNGDGDPSEAVVLQPPLNGGVVEFLTAYRAARTHPE